jgi:hypothetical protein
MAGIAFGNPTGGFWPLGKITVAAAGTPVPINTNVGAQGQSALHPAKHIRGLIISSLQTTTPGKRLYLVKHGYTKSNTNGIIAVLVGGSVAGATTDPQPIFIPNYLLEGGAPTIDVIDLDADENGANCQVTAIY